MKKIIASLLVIIVIAVAAANGITFSYVFRAPSVASGIGAKLLCSSRFVSGYSREQSESDLVQYSPILQYLSIDYDEVQRKVSTSLFGLAKTTASYQEGIGCYTEYPGFSQRQQFESFPMPVFSSHWPHGSRVETIRADAQSWLDAMVAADNADGLNTRALLVVHRGEIIAESYAQGTDAFTPVLGWSMAKSLSAIMLGNLELRGLLDAAKQPVFAQWASDNRREIALEHLLTMTDGLDFSEEYNPGHDATTMLFTTPSASGYALGRPLSATPGTFFNYSSGTANLLSRLYFEHTGSESESASLNTAMADFRRHIAGPLSFQNTIFEPDAAGVFVGSSYLYASARDWARMGQLMLNKGVLNGERVVSEDWVQRATSVNSSENGRAYGYQWWLNSGNARLRWPDLPADAYAAQGNRQQSVTVIPAMDMVVVRLGWTSGRYPINDRIAQILSWLEQN
jgi:CubicO group peptidase (beta-lactamase class C family)